MPRPIQLPLPLFANLAYPTDHSGRLRQCAWCGKVLDRYGRFRIVAPLLRAEASHGCCSVCAAALRPRRV
ncbi:MAG: hypothetical protein JO023_10115 [Chloroflexi bacterium]|nr:hypothetical protein [Chloroflexota bacterium]